MSTVFDDSLLHKYNINGPRYTSYPTALQFTPAVAEAEYLMQAEASNQDFIPRALSLYLHLPFCRTVCFYCGCNRIITANYPRAQAYLAQLRQEAQMQSSLFDKDRQVVQLHLGGGTPTYYQDRDLEELMAHLAQCFPLSTTPNRDFSLEIDPRTVNPMRIRRLAGLGFNRMSLGVQDFDPQVQQAINRIQSLQQTREIIDAARAAGFRSVNFDLIYGLPAQTLAGFAHTLEAVVDMRPQRIALYSYAHLPQLLKTQRRIDSASLPSAELKLSLLTLAIEQLLAAGYVYIGMDHFALPEDELAIARREGHLHRNFQGYSTHSQCDLVALGVSAISKMGDCYVQNHRNIADYEAALASAELPIWRGVTLSLDDRIRRDVIMAIMCRPYVAFAPLERRYGICFQDYFQPELNRLAELQDDGLLVMTPEGFEITAQGRLLLRAIAMSFDVYLPERQIDRPHYSRLCKNPSIQRRRYTMP